MMIIDDVPTCFTNNHAQSMLLRDYFAAAALPMAIQEMNEAESYDINDAAIVAYQYADAMMKQRSEK
jgi:hypothetical protein